MRRTDLTVKTAQELRRLADHLGVDVTGCLEKGELVERITASPQVQIVAAGGEEESGSATGSTSPASGLPTVSLAQLEAMPSAEVQALMQQCGIEDPLCTEKPDMIRQLVLSGRIHVASNDEVVAPPRSAAPAARRPESAVHSAAPAPAAAPMVGRNDAEPLAGKSVGELRQLARRLGVSLDGCLEKGEIVQRIEAAQIAA